MLLELEIDLQYSLTLSTQPLPIQSDNIAVIKCHNFELYLSKFHVKRSVRDPPE